MQEKNDHYQTPFLSQKCNVNFIFPDPYSSINPLKTNPLSVSLKDFLKLQCSSFILQRHWSYSEKKVLVEIQHDHLLRAENNETPYFLIQSNLKDNNAACWLIRGAINSRHLMCISVRHVCHIVSPCSEQFSDAWHDSQHTWYTPKNAWYSFTLLDTRHLLITLSANFN